MDQVDGGNKRITQTQEGTASLGCSYSLDDDESVDQKIEVLGLLGEGGMGIVEEGWQVCLDRAVALKSCRVGDDFFAQRDLVREGNVLAALEHPNILPIFGRDRVGGKTTLVCKKIVGSAWSEELSALSFEENVVILFKVMDAIRFAHSQGIVHRDLKPSNIMIGSFGEVYVLDWGAAVSLNPLHRGRLPLASEVSRPLGSAPYMAPEMLDLSLAPISETTDVYLLGAILYEIATGEPPHSADSLFEIRERVEACQPSFPAEMPTELVAILQSTMRRDPSTRLGSVNELKAALEEFLQHQTSLEQAQRGSELLKALESASRPECLTERLAIYDLYRRCKFTLQEALRTWPNNLAAREALESAALLIVDYELARSDPSAAKALLDELNIDSASASMRIQAAVRQQQEQHEKLASVYREVDSGIFSDMRRGIMTAIAMLWGIVPLALYWFVAPTTYLSQSVVHLAFLVGWLLLGWRGNALVNSSGINRGLFHTVACAGVLAITFNVGAYLVGLEAGQAQVFHLFVFFSASLTTVVFLEPEISPSALAYLVAFIVSSLRPDIALLMMAAANATLALNLLSTWSGDRAGSEELEQPYFEGVSSGV